MKKINKLLVAIIIATSHPVAYTADPAHDIEERASHWFGVDGAGRLVNVPNRDSLSRFAGGALATVQDGILDLSALPATSMRRLWDPENFGPTEQSDSDEVKAFFNDSGRHITLIAPTALERIECTMPLPYTPYDRLRWGWGPAIAFVDLSGCSALKTIGYQAFRDAG
ncbi:MAG: hypothetical protein LBU35_03145, partial [Holosporales bacterium]|nr:hypothetical protein [Holosporales bacterium]